MRPRGRDLLRRPLWRAESVGLPLPPEQPHAVTAALPLWSQVIAYEEADPAIVGAMRTGYPRFFLHPLVLRLFAEARSALAGGGEDLWLWPSAGAARRAARFIARRIGAPVRCIPWRGGLHAVVFPDADAPRAAARACWQHGGEIIGSRRAEALLDGAATPDAARAQEALRARLGAWTGQPADCVRLFPTGMAALGAALRAARTRRPGLPSAQVDFPYVDSLKTQQTFGDPLDAAPPPPLWIADPAKAPARIRECREGLCAVLAETPSNPLLRCADLPALAAALGEIAPLIADDTICGPACTDALGRGGADAAIYSLTKTINGRGDAMGGALVLRADSPWRGRLQATLDADAATPMDPQDALFIERRSRSYPERAARMSATALALAERLRAHPAVAAVAYPAWASRAAYDAIRRPGGGSGPLLSVILRDPAAAPRLYDALRVCKGPNLGADWTLVCPYTLLAHYHELDWAEQRGAPAHLIRVSVGLEEPAELIARFEQALGAAQAARPPRPSGARAG